MKYENPWVDPRVQTVRVPAIRNYMARKGWNLLPSTRPQILVFEGPLDDDGQPIRQMVPALEQGNDYAPCVADLITNLARLEDRYAVEVLNDILREDFNGEPAAHREPAIAGSMGNGRT